MLPEKVVDLLNKQIKIEMYSQNLYLNMASWFDEKGYEGFSQWYYIQAQEEYDHAMIIFKYMEMAGERPLILDIDKPKQDFDDARNVFEEALEHEEFVTASINKVMKAALEEDDYKTKLIMDWFVEEQMEEEDNASSNLDRYNLFCGDANALLSLDNELGQRRYSMSSKRAELEGLASEAEA